MFTVTLQSMVASVGVTPHIFPTYKIASGGVISRTRNFGVISRTFLERVYFVILFLHRNSCSCHFQKTGLKLLEPVVRTGLPLIIKKLEDFV